MTGNSTLDFDSRVGYMTMFENATVAILVIDKSGKILLANKACDGMFGYQERELNNKSIEILIPHSKRGSHAGHREKYMDNPHPRPMGTGMELYGLRKDDSEFPVEISLAGYNVGEYQFSVAFINDITRRKQSELSEKLQKLELERKIKEHTRELAESLRREKQLNELKSRFVSMASHEFRTPLSSILTSASLVNSYLSKNEPEKAEKHLKRIKSSITNLTQILNDFLSIDKIEQGKIETVKEKIELEDFIRIIAEEMEGNLKPGQQISYTHRGESILVSDPQLLKNVLINLISNASKYSFDCSLINIESSLESGMLQIKIADQGIGIPEKDKDKLFGLFFRAGNVGEINGTGLGLNIVARYIELLNGNITYTSIENKGTTFFITIPQQSL